MTTPWFSEIPAALALFPLLAILVLVGEQRRFTKALSAMWICAMAVSALLLSAMAVAVSVGQPMYLVRSLALLAVAVGFPFGVTFPALRRADRDAELRKTIAADI